MSGGASGLPIVGGIFSAFGDEQAGSDKAQASNYNAGIADYNANATLQDTAEATRMQRVVGAQKVGDIRASYGASGVSSSTGSALDILQSSARNAELDALKVKHAGEMKAYGYTQSASLDRMNASAATRAGNWGAAKDIFGGVSGAIDAGAFD